MISQIHRLYNESKKRMLFFLEVSNYVKVDEVVDFYCHSKKLFEQRYDSRLFSLKFERLCLVYLTKNRGTTISSQTLYKLHERSLEIPCSQLLDLQLRLFSNSYENQESNLELEIFHKFDYLALCALLHPFPSVRTSAKVYLELRGSEKTQGIRFFFEKQGSFISPVIYFQQSSLNN